MFIDLDLNFNKIHLQLSYISLYTSYPTIGTCREGKTVKAGTMLKHQIAVNTPLARDMHWKQVLHAYA